MHVHLKLLSILLLFWAPLFGQVQLRGLSFWSAPELQIYQIDNQFSKEKIWLQTVKPDTMGIFTTQLDLPTTSTLQICGAKKCALLYAQPKARYLIELPLEEQQTFYNTDEQEIELLFYQLDTNDINYRILGFEAWMDDYLADIYQLKDIRSHEFILKVMAFKAETAAVYGNDTSTFLRDYIKYSVGQTIDNFSVIGGPSKDDKFSFYLQTDTVNYSQPKLIEYARLFYEKYETQVDQNTRLAIEMAIASANSAALVAALQNDPYIYNKAWAEFVALQLILEFDQNKRSDKPLTLALLKSLASNGQQKSLKSAARYFWLEKSKLDNGSTWDRNYVVNELQIKLASNQYVYMHHYIPGNQKCIAEMAALKRLAKRYENKVQILTFYPSEQAWTNADQKAFEGATWQRLALPQTHELWQQLSWSSAPAYILLDPQLKVLNLDALGPLPNARTQTIDLILSQLISN
jgi:hypothetical protein